MNSTKKLYKDKKNEMIGGVCAGLSDYFDVDVTLVRLGMVLIGLMYGAGIVLYIIAMIIMPDKSTIIEDTINEAEKNEDEE